MKVFYFLKYFVRSYLEGHTVKDSFKYAKKIVYNWK